MATPRTAPSEKKNYILGFNFVVILIDLSNKSVKTCSKKICTSNQLKNEIKQLAINAVILQSIKNLVISWCYFAVDGYEMNKDLRLPYTCTSFMAPL